MIKESITRIASQLLPRQPASARVPQPSPPRLPLKPTTPFGFSLPLCAAPAPIVPACEMFWQYSPATPAPPG